ncbi:MAG: ABC transporter substrate-binding protein, partial [Chloroflexota bacterium]|nr:ABC transporter substrate-binding protein [Chloroflexota bacterium]
DLLCSPVLRARLVTGRRVVASPAYLKRLRLPLLMLALLALAGWLLRDVILPQPPLLPAGVLRVGVDPSSPPFAYYEGNALVGLEIDLSTALGDRLGVPVQLVALGFDGLYDALRADQADVIIAATSPDPQRTVDVIFSRPYFDNGLLIVSPASAPLPAMQVVAGRELALAFGSSAHTEANRWLRRVAAFTIRPYELPLYALDAVRLGDADAALVSAVDAYLYLRDYPDWEPHTAYVTHAPYVAAVNSQRGKLAAALDSAIDALQSDGTLAQLTARWLYSPA